MSAILSGPMFERSGQNFKAQRCLNCGAEKDGAHYNLFQIKGGMVALRGMFPDGQANDLNFALFSTSGVHGTYTTIEEIETGLQKYPDGPPDNEDCPDDYHGNSLTVVIVHPRICCLRYGCVSVTLGDIPFLKKLRQTSWEAVQTIGKDKGETA